MPVMKEVIEIAFDLKFVWGEPPRECEFEVKLHKRIPLQAD
jgi:hypothetical protein